MNKKPLLGVFAAFFIVTLAVPSAFASEPWYCFGKFLAGGCTTIPMETDYQWTLQITVISANGMQDAVVTDRFGAEIEIDEPFPLYYTPGTEKPSYYTKGESDKVFLTWVIGDLEPGETATLQLLISTDINPAGKQEYTTPSICGCPETYYQLNSGATLKFKFEGKQYSATTDPIMIFVQG